MRLFLYWYLKACIISANAQTQNREGCEITKLEKQWTGYKRGTRFQRERERYWKARKRDSGNRIALYVVSLDEPLPRRDEDGHLQTLHDILSNPEPDAYQEAERGNLRGKLVSLIESLDHRRAAIILKYFGLSSESLPLRELAKTYGISQERVRQLIHEGITRIRLRARKMGLRDFLYE